MPTPMDVNNVIKLLDKVRQLLLEAGVDIKPNESIGVQWGKLSEPKSLSK